MCSDNTLAQKWVNQVSGEMETCLWGKSPFETRRKPFALLGGPQFGADSKEQALA